MSEVIKPSEPVIAAKSLRNPFEVGLPIFGTLALIVGIIVSAVGDSVYASAVRVSELANTLSSDYFDTPSRWGQQLGTFGNQLSTIGLAILIGMAFYLMARWNKARE